MKLHHIAYTLAILAVLLLALWLVVNSPNVKATEYHHCLVTTINHDICKDLTP